MFLFLKRALDLTIDIDDLFLSWESNWFELVHQSSFFLHCVWLRIVNLIVYLINAFVLRDFVERCLHVRMREKKITETLFARFHKIEISISHYVCILNNITIQMSHFSHALISCSCDFLRENEEKKVRNSFALIVWTKRW